MAFVAARGFVDLTAKDSAFQRSMKAAERRLKSVGIGFAQVSRIAKKFLIGGSAAVAAFVKVASDAQETASKFDAVFKEQSKSVRAFADTLATQTKRSRLDLEVFLAALQDTFVPLGFAREEAARLSKRMVQLGIDIASFQNIADAEVMNSLTSAIVGNAEAVRKFGIVANEGAVNAQLFRMGIEGGNRAATAQQKSLAILNIILRSTTDAQGDAIRTADQFANTFKGLRSVIKDTSADIGNIFLPEVQKMVEGLTRWIEANRDTIESNRELILSITKMTIGASAGALVVEKLTNILTNFVIIIALAGKKIVALAAAISLPAIIALAAAFGIAAIAINKVNKELVAAIKRNKSFAETQKRLLAIGKGLRDVRADILQIEKEITAARGTPAEQARRLLDLDRERLKILDLNVERVRALLESNRFNVDQENRLSDLLIKKLALRNKLSAQIIVDNANLKTREEFSAKEAEQEKSSKKQVALRLQIQEKLNEAVLDRLTITNPVLASEKEITNETKKQLAEIEKIVQARVKAVDPKDEEERAGFEKLFREQAQPAVDAINQLGKARLKEQRRNRRREVRDFVLSDTEKSIAERIGEAKRIAALTKNVDERRRIFAKARGDIREILRAGAELEIAPQVRPMFVGLQEQFRRLQTAGVELTGQQKQRQLQEAELRVAKESLAAIKKSNIIFNELKSFLSVSVGNLNLITE